MADHTDNGGKKAPRTLFSLGRSSGAKNPVPEEPSVEATAETVQLDAAATTKHCPNCGSQLPVYAKFCGDCGTEQPEGLVAGADVADAPEAAGVAVAAGAIADEVETDEATELVAEADADDELEAADDEYEYVEVDAD